MTYITIDNEDYTMRSTMTVRGDMRDVDKIVSRALHAREPREDISGYFFCEACGGYVEYGWRFCPKCGQRMKL